MSAEVIAAFHATKFSDDETSDHENETEIEKHEKEDNPENRVVIEISGKTDQLINIDFPKFVDNQSCPILVKTLTDNFEPITKSEIKEDTNFVEKQKAVQNIDSG